MTKIFVTRIETQEREIGHFCFDACGKVIMAGIYDEQFGWLSPCYQENCPFLADEMGEPFGEISGGRVYARKLKEYHETQP